jgi:hypothetical protein
VTWKGTWVGDAREPSGPSAVSPDHQQGHPVDSEPVGPRRLTARTVVGWVTTGLAALLVLLVLVAPTETGHLTPAGFLRVPVEALVGVALVLALPARPRRWFAGVLGVALGLLAVVKVMDVGFFAVLDRSFHPVLDWGFLEAGVVFLTSSMGRPAAVGTVIGALVVALMLLALMALSVQRLAGVAVRHQVRARPVVAALTVVWAACAVTNVQLVPQVPVAAHVTVDRLGQVRAGLQDGEAFAHQIRVDPFRSTAPTDLLPALRGKDVVVAFVESYGRVATEHPSLAPVVGPRLDAGTNRLEAAGFQSRSAYLTSPTVGGGSWLAQITLLSGLWVDNQHRYEALLATDRLTLTGAFRRAGWRTVGVMPGVILDWPEGSFFDYDRIYAAKDLGYRGPNFSFATMPDQYTLSAFERLERARADRPPLMAVIPLISSHAPWAPVPPLVEWGAVGDGSGYRAQTGAGDPADVVLGRDPERVRADYAHAIGYSIDSVVSYVEKYGDDDLVVVLLGDHQPAPVITGEGASRDAPITVITRDPAVLHRIAGWGWQAGLNPGPAAPVWPMHAFRDRFLTAFGP